MEALAFALTLTQYLARKQAVVARALNILNRQPMLMLIQYSWYKYKVYESFYIVTSCWLWSLVHPPCKSLQKFISNLDTAFLAFHISQCSFWLDRCEGLGWADTADTGKLMNGDCKKALLKNVSVSSWLPGNRKCEKACHQHPTPK